MGTSCAQSEEDYDSCSKLHTIPQHHLHHVSYTMYQEDYTYIHVYMCMCTGVQCICSVMYCTMYMQYNVLYNVHVYMQYNVLYNVHVYAV